MHDDDKVSNVTKGVLCRDDLTNLPQPSIWLERPLHKDMLVT